MYYTLDRNPLTSVPRALPTFSFSNIRENHLSYLSYLSYVFSLFCTLSCAVIGNNSSISSSLHGISFQACAWNVCGTCSGPFKVIFPPLCTLFLFFQCIDPRVTREMRCAVEKRQIDIIDITYEYLDAFCQMYQKRRLILFMDTNLMISIRVSRIITIAEIPFKL